MVLAARGWPGWPVFIWTTPGHGRGADRGDGGEPADRRRAGRAKSAHGAAGNPDGDYVKASRCWGWRLAGFAVLHVAAWQLNSLALLLAPVAMVAVTFYSYTKRFTWSSHWLLGLADGIAPVGGWIAVTGEFSTEAALLALVVTFWIGGFDVLYATQDVDFDRAEGLHSIPARFGLAAALGVARASHALTIGVLLALGFVAALGWPYWVGVAVIGPAPGLREPAAEARRL